MTNIRFTKKNRHPRRNNGGVSSGKKENREDKLFSNDINTNFSADAKKSYDNVNTKWNQINLK